MLFKGLISVLKKESLLQLLALQARESHSQTSSSSAAKSWASSAHTAFVAKIQALVSARIDFLIVVST